MRILTISNLYPPHFIGGYELGCRDVMQRLVQRGHQVEVLTSTWQVEEAGTEDDGSIKVHRRLGHFIGYERPSTRQLWRLNPHNRTTLLELVRNFKPDVLYLWNMGGLPPRLNFDAQQTGIPVCYYVSDLWLSRWQNEQQSIELKRPNWKAIALSLIWHYSGLQPHPQGLKFRCVQCTSDFIKQATMRSDLRNTPDVDTIYQVIHWGVDVEKFQAATQGQEEEQTKRNQGNKTPFRLIYAGQLAPHKGVATAIEAVQHLKKSGYKVKLTIAGPDTYGNHGNELRELVQCLALQEEIEFLGPVRREELPKLLASQELFIFPAIWDEPFSIGLLEAMATGLAIVSTTTGGSKEIVCHEENALVFPPGDVLACATQIKRLLDDSVLREKLSFNAQRLVYENFTMETMIQRIEESLQAALKSHHAR